jgi:hypothetical protein
MTANTTTMRKNLRPIHRTLPAGIDFDELLKLAGLAADTSYEDICDAWYRMGGNILFVASQAAMALPDNAEAARFIKLYTELPRLPEDLAKGMADHLQNLISDGSSEDLKEVLLFFIPTYKETTIKKDLREMVKQTLRCHAMGYPYHARQGVKLADTVGYFIKPDRKAEWAIVLPIGCRNTRTVRLSDIQAL